MLTMILGEECGRSKPLPYEIDVVLLNKCGKFVGSIHESTATDAKADDQWKVPTGADSLIGQPRTSVPTKLMSFCRMDVQNCRDGS